MGDKSKIEWTGATWNPVVGCTLASPGCTRCYAMGQAARIERMFAGTTGATHYRGLTRQVNGRDVWTGKLASAPDHIWEAPLHWRRPRDIFVNSMGDLFHEHMPVELIDRAFAIMALCPQHRFQVLTKRSAVMRAYCELIENEPTEDTVRRIAAVWPKNHPIPPAITFPLPNVWLGVSAERQREADERIPDLLATPAAVRFVSLEPLIGPIDLTRVAVDPAHFDEPETWFDSLAGEHCYAGNFAGANKCARLDWVIVGGESGDRARPMSKWWATQIRDQCQAAHVPFFFKQWGEWAPTTEDTTIRVGKKTAGRLLDGREWNEKPAQEGN